MPDTLITEHDYLSAFEDRLFEWRVPYSPEEWSTGQAPFSHIGAFEVLQEIAHIENRAGWCALGPLESYYV